MKALTATALLSLLFSPMATAVVIANYDFENYSAGSTGETALLDEDTDPRVYNANGTLPTGISSISAITFSVAPSGTAGGQNKVESNNGSLRYRWRLMDAPVTASFSVTVAAGFQIQNFSLSLVQFANNTGTIDVTYNGNAMGPQGSIDSDDTLDAGSIYATNSVASAVSGTVNFVITVDPNANNRTSRWDDIVLSADVVAVPEPSSSLLAVIGLMGAAVMRRRR